MGVTIHFEGQLIDEVAYGSLVDAARAFASAQGWQTESIQSQEVTLLRVRDEKEWDYCGPVKGIVLHPHEECDTVRLEFDRDLYIQEFTKTQFAGPQIHLKVLELLNVLSPFFSKLEIEDEGEYWETKDVELLTSHMNWSRDVIEAELRKNPSAQTKVRTPDGKIIDLMT